MEQTGDQDMAVERNRRNSRNNHNPIMRAIKAKIWNILGIAIIIACIILFMRGGSATESNSLRMVPSKDGHGIHGLTHGDDVKLMRQDTYDETEDTEDDEGRF